jgi:tetratricopeptide (TPR) repeat protein
LFCVDGVRLVYAASNVIEEQLAEVLAERAVLSPPALIAAHQAAEKRSISITAALVEGGEVDMKSLRQAFEQHIRELLFDTLGWNEGECRFDPGTPDLGNELTADLCSVGVIVDYARHHATSASDLQIRIGPPNSRPRLCEAREAVLDQFEPDATTRFVLEASDGVRTASEIIAAADAPDEVAWRALYGLVLLGALEIESGEIARDQRPDGEISRAEVLARLERSTGADAYTMLELNASCSPDEIRDAYYFLARRYHPDRFRAGSLQDMLPRIESFFAQVTESYNTLFNPEQRRAYDQQRASGISKPAAEKQDTRYLAKQNYLRARVLIDKGRRTDAVQYLANAIQLDDSHAAYHLDLGRLLSGNPRRRSEAEELLIRVNELDPADVEGYLALGELYVKQGRDDDAKRMFREVLSWEPGHLEATALLKEHGGGKRGLFGG